MLRRRLVLFILIPVSLLLGLWFIVRQREPVISISAQQIALNPNGTLLAAATQHGIQLWALPERRLTRSFDTGEAHSVVAWSPDGDFIATDGAHFTIDIWNVAQNIKAQSLGSTATIPDGVAFSPDGTLVAATDRASTTRVWRWREHQMLYTLSHFIPYVSSVAFSPDGQLLATGNAVTEVWRVSDGTNMNFPYGKGGDINAVAFSTNGQYLVSGDGEGNVHSWDVKGRRLLRTIRSHDGSISALAISPDNRLVAVGGGMTYQQRLGETTIKIWNIQDGALVAALPTSRNAITSLIFESDGKTLIIASADGTISFRRMYK